MNLETKLNLSTASFVLVMFLGAGAAHLRIQNVSRLAVVMTSERRPLLFDLQKMQTDLGDSVVNMQASILAGADASKRAVLNAAAAEARTRAEADLVRLQAIDDRLDLGPDEGRLDEIGRQWKSLDRYENEVEGASDGQAAETLLLNKILPLQREIESASSALIASQQAITEEKAVALRIMDHSVVWWLWGATILGAGLAGFLSTMLARRVTRAIGLVAERAAAIASGDLTGAELEIESGDQIGALATGMQAMQSGLASILGTVADTAGSLTGSAASMRSASDKMHRRIDQQSQQTRQAATAMQEMSASIAEVSQHTQSAAETAREAAQTAREGGLIVKQMLGSMHSIAAAVTETSSTVELLGEDSKRISQIVTVIDEIARNTNLLALNAAIEAARAGEQGRGFAVVASEVRRLAESTAEATGEIATMIQEIQDRTRTAIASMAAGRGTVQEGVVTTTQAGGALERIIGLAERVDRMITQIAIAASQQAAAADQSSASLDSIHSLSHENLTEMATTAAGIETLRGTVVTLERQVDRFPFA
jgi:methyl-accepting chemotaxis protein